jgi:hypothetical protein
MNICLDNVIVAALVEQWLAARPGDQAVKFRAKSQDAESETAKSETQ